MNELLYPSEAPIERSGPVASISVDYPANELAIFGWRVPWLVPFVGLSLVFALVLKRPFGVVF